MLETIMAVYWATVVLSLIVPIVEVWKAYNGQVYLSWAELIASMIACFIPAINLIIILDLLPAPDGKFFNTQVFKGKKK